MARRREEVWCRRERKKLLKWKRNWSTRRSNSKIHTLRNRSCDEKIACATHSRFAESLNAIDRHTWFAHYARAHDFDLRLDERAVWPGSVHRHMIMISITMFRRPSVHNSPSMCQQNFVRETATMHSRRSTESGRPVRRWWRTNTASPIHVRMYLTQFVRCNKIIINNKKTVINCMSTGCRTAALHSWPIHEKNR